MAQQALADRAGISRSFLAELEADQQSPRLRDLRKLADALNEPIERLIVDVGDGPSTSVVSSAPVTPSSEGDPLGRRAHGGEREVHSVDQTSEGMADTDLVEFALMLDRRGISGGALTAAELACEQLDQQFARLGPDDVLWKLRLLMSAILAQLREPQSLGHQPRLMTLAGRLAGLRAWACFDIDEHGEAERWYDVAVTAAQEAEAWSLGAWLLGAQSLIPWHRRDRRRTVELIERGIYLASRGGDSTTQAWLHALEARGRASLGDRHGFEAAYTRAQEAAEYSSERDRRHGMDFDQGLLDLRYYAGTSWLLLRQPDQADPALRGSLTALPDSHTKARAVVTLALADAAVQRDSVEQAVGLTREALTATQHQPIMPILQQARRIRRLVQQRNPTAARDLDAEVHGFARALAAVATRVEL
jgi:DNA-binding XRE family transcriptional regulator